MYGMPVLDDDYEAHRKAQIESTLGELKRYIERATVKRTGDLTIDRIVYRLIRLAK